MLLRSDCGTENTNVAFIHPYLRRYGTDPFKGMDSYRYGKSTTNQVTSQNIVGVLSNVYLENRSLVEPAKKIMHSLVVCILQGILCI